MADKLFGKETIAGAEKVRNTAAEIQDIFGKIDMTQLSKGMQTMAKSSQDMAGELSNSLKYSKENQKIAKNQSKSAVLQAKYATSQNKIAKTFRSFQISMLKGQDDFTTGLKESSQEYNNLKQGAKNLVTEMGNALESVSELDNLFGGVGQTIGSFVTNPLTIATALLVGFNAQQESIAKEFGAIGVTEFRDELAGASQEFVQLGMEGSEALTTIKSLGTEFGISFEAATNLADSVADLSVSTGLAATDSTKLLGALTTIGGLSEDAALNFSKSAEQLAIANGIAPNVILKDIADNTETFAKFSQTGTQGLARAAIQARKLGVELSDVAGAMEGMLDFQSSLNAEVEASVLLGRNLNLQKARELSLAGDIEGFQTEILKQVGSEAEFNKMNVLQKKALASATNMSVEALSKMVSKEKEAVTLSGAFAKASKDMIPEEAMTSTAQILADFQVLGMELAEKFGPAIHGIVSAFSSVVGFLMETKVILPAIIGFMATLKVLSLAVAIANTFTTAMKSFDDIPLVGIALGIGAAIAAIGTLMSFVGDAVVPAGMTDRPMVSPAGSPNTLVGRKDDDILMAPGIAGVKAAANTATNVVNNTVDTSRLEKQSVATNTKLDQLITAMMDAPKKTGKAAGKAFGGMM